MNYQKGSLNVRNRTDTFPCASKYRAVQGRARQQRRPSASPGTCSRLVCSSNRRWQVALRARRDGRRVEKQLQSWLTSVPQADHLHQELTEALTTFLASYGKSPSTACRISVTSDFYQSQNNRSADDHVLTNLLIAVASRLSPEERLGLRAAL